MLAVSMILHTLALNLGYKHTYINDHKPFVFHISDKTWLNTKYCHSGVSNSKLILSRYWQRIDLEQVSLRDAEVKSECIWSGMEAKFVHLQHTYLISDWLVVICYNNIHCICWEPTVNMGSPHKAMSQEAGFKPEILHVGTEWKDTK